ncbi:putative metalloprotease CJM1_0395 family protein [Thalassospira lucentensis]|uniref:putative metalloprotease CJM1_0395 family protein n=1 Tax=Thalassospira lucentensis TaxID=168935 RepID=UPI003AA80F4E
MIATGQTIANPNGGGMGVILNVREIAQTADGRVLAEYEAVEVASSGVNTSSPYAISGKDSDAARSRLVDPRTLTEAQAVAAGVSRAEYRQARETNEKQDGVTGVGSASSNADLEPAEKATVAQLQARDSAVRQEERAHAAAAGPYGSAPQYEYQIGPDGKAYAIGGHVDVGISMTGSAADRDRALATLQNAAMAPNAPSGADMAAFRQASLQRATAKPDSDASIPKESILPDNNTGNDRKPGISISV